MKQYLDVLRDIRENGEWKENRTGIRTLMIDGACSRYNLRQGFPAVTTKRLAWKAVKGELCGFLRGFTSAADFREFGCKVWDANANENKAWLNNPFRKGTDDLGVVYGAQWRNWQAFKDVNYTDIFRQNLAAIENILINDGWEPVIHPDARGGTGVYTKSIDQIHECVTKIITDPDNRRILFHGWNPAVLDEIALPSCHLLYQFLPNKDTKEMSLCMYQRSTDTLLGAPFNIASASLLLEIMCHLTGYAPKNFVHFMADVHIYESHLEAVDEQLTREPLPLPKLKITGLKTYKELCYEAQSKYHSTDGEVGKDVMDFYLIEGIMNQIDNIHPDMFELENYQHHSPLTAPMAV